MAGRRGFGTKLKDRDVLFLAYYFGADPKTKGNMLESARAAGFAESTAVTKAPRLLKRFEDGSFRACAKAVGVTKPFLAYRLMEILKLPVEKNYAGILAATRLVLANMGEATDGASSVNITSQGPTMVIIGATAERMKALKSATPQLSRKELADEENARVEKKLEMLKNGTLPPLSRWADGRPAHKHEVIDVEIVDQQDGARESQAGAPTDPGKS